jgi:hypothetical protein
MANLAGIRFVSNLWRQGEKQIDAARERNSITHSAKRLRQTGKTLGLKAPADAGPSGDSTFPFVCNEVEKLPAPFAQKSGGSRFALTMFLQAGRIGLSRRRALRTSPPWESA